MKNSKTIPLPPQLPASKLLIHPPPRPLRCTSLRHLDAVRPEPAAHLGLAHGHAGQPHQVGLVRLGHLEAQHAVAQHVAAGLGPHGVLQLRVQLALWDVVPPLAHLHAVDVERAQQVRVQRLLEQAPHPQPRALLVGILLQGPPVHPPLVGRHEHPGLVAHDLHHPLRRLVSLVHQEPRLNRHRAVRLLRRRRHRRCCSLLLRLARKQIQLESPS
mmetsp:Transcript_19722/g.49455  ORF Transcript_19722/g.49455 Transcript_19722/m.49455 type:complete len:215 (-) Transcript_19722:309-953(-)